MNLIRTEQIQVKGTKELSALCHLSKNLYNQANYVVKQEFITTGNWIKGFDLIGKCKGFENYKLLNIQSAQQTIRLVDKNWTSYFASIKEWKKHHDKFLGIPKMPHYKPKDGEAILVFTNQQAHIRNHNLTFTKKLPLKIKTRLSGKINQVRFIPKGTGYTCEVIYEKQSEEGEINKRLYAKRVNSKRIIGIDLGLRNVVTIANNIGEKPIVIKGGILKSTNQFYNKEKAQLQSIYDKQGIKFGTRMSQLNSKRNNKIKDTMHKISRYTIDYCLENNIGTIVIGKNDNWKQETNMGKKNNQNFVQIPHFKLIQMLQYKAEAEGITVKLQQESHTSKCSFLDSEPVCHQDTYKGVRFTRGLFRSANGTILNSDVNGAYNIIRKAIPDAFAKGIEGVGLHPIRSNTL
ncbi:MAG TPA: transposase [Candidatus Methanoperedens sp.]|nr:transposase [Candidatus Methanoperedens sp.]